MVRESKRYSTARPITMTMARRQLTLFDRPARRKPRIVMHIADAGSGMIFFRCRRCGHEPGWAKMTGTISANKRGKPCPNCNKLDASNS